MKVFSTPMLLGSVATVLMAATTFETFAAEPASDVIEVRWVMAGLAKDADPRAR